ncbi:MAG: hypothetical protein GTN89_00275 [Acidobacteria bacterium]|nr:hypothetical protein [Acidobacteriota bacterium]NIM60157.1 hypothetical protein [Acidobacteriota bacterium]NIO57826.1 hypothetical protein [Acidobacteriota bacterium]NIQ28835.1 hypothetical protein [Acidobacteriota bacterium]NIQ83293.1 hypothetical protein [Acidobacteriota bacterium]
MSAVSVAVHWLHLLSAALFLGTMFVGTFVLLPTLKAHLEHAERRKFIVHFIPRVRRIMRVVVSLLVLSGVAQILLKLPSSEPASATVVGVLASHIFFAALPVAIFALAPRILGAKSEDGLCCDPDADDPPIFKGLMSSKGAMLHYVAISGGWIAVLCAIILGHLG